ncbi:phenylalanine--tRNA ligase subunit beta [Candidatus Woesearchaeota archaeon]|nr:phenylalanine--tRNA ligase subunit beta [Candidatus Woesearchaeota archaeon]
MAGITFSKKRLELLIGKKLSVEQWHDRTMMLGFGFEGIAGDDLTVEVFPNRPDCLSEQGFARAMRAFLGLPARKLPVAKSSTYEVIVDKSVDSVRPFTACAVVTGLTFDDASLKNIIQFQEKLHATFCRHRKKAAIGIYPMEHIAWPISYVAKRPSDIRFQPLEGGKVMSGKEILEHHPTGKTYAPLLAHAEKYPLFIDAKHNILSMPPIINSEHAGRVTHRTNDVFVECSGFHVAFVSQVLNLVVLALADAGGVVHQVTVRANKKQVFPALTVRKHALAPAYVSRIVGKHVSDADLKRLLPKLGHELRGTEVIVPWYRTDILHACDLVEDVAIAAGYEHISSEIPNVATVANESPRVIFARRVSHLLIGLGMLETNTFHLTSKEAQTTSMLTELQLVELENSLNAEYTSMRAWMLPSLMDVLKTNRPHEYPQKLFGIGTAFGFDKNAETGIAEKQKLALLTCHPKADYTEIRQLVEFLLDRLGLVYSFKEHAHPSCIPGRCASVSIDKQEIGFLGELHPHAIRNRELELPVAVCELDLDALFARVKN